MFEVAEPPPNSESSDQCPMVYMHDVPVELSNIIKALYDGVSLNLRNTSIEDFFYAAGILRMSTKYCIAHLRTQVIQHLAKTWSYTLKGHDDMLELALTTPPVDGLTYPFVHPLHVLNLALSTDARILIPSALYFLSLYPLSDLLQGDHPKLQIEHASRPLSNITMQTLQDYTLVFQYRIQLLLDFSRKTCATERTVPADCKNNTQCTRAFHRLSNLLSRQWNPRTGPFHFMRQAQDQLLEMPDVCTACRTAFSQDADNLREESWRALPGVVGLPSWETLEAESHETTLT